MNHFSVLLTISLALLLSSCSSPDKHPSKQEPIVSDTVLSSAPMDTLSQSNLESLSSIENESEPKKEQKEEDGAVMPKSNPSSVEVNESSDPVTSSKDSTPKPANNQSGPGRLANPALTGIPIKKDKPDHAIFNTLLHQNVSYEGIVNYKDFQKRLPALKSYVKHLAEIPPLKTWSKNERLAYYINLYNANTILLVIPDYPIKSITKLNGGKPWDKIFVQSGDKTYSLSQIENDIIRPQFKDGRVHFALNCAAISCPKLLNQAYLPERLEAQLETQTKYFLNNQSKNTLSKKKLELSKIFEWYGQDFGRLVPFLQKYHKEELSNAKITYKEYNWGLNDRVE